MDSKPQVIGERLICSTKYVYYLVSFLARRKPEAELWSLIGLVGKENGEMRELYKTTNEMGNLRLERRGEKGLSQILKKVKIKLSAHQNARLLAFGTDAEATS